MAYPLSERDPERQEQDAKSFNNALKIGASLVPDYRDPKEVSEFYTDLRAGVQGATAAALLDGPLPFGEAAGFVGGFGASRLSRKMGQEIIEQIFGTKKVWDNGWKAALPDGRTVDWGSKWWSTTLDTPLTATRFAVKTYDGLNQRMDKAYVKNKKLIKQKQG